MKAASLLRVTVAGIISFSCSFIDSRLQAETAFQETRINAGRGQNVPQHNCDFPQSADLTANNTKETRDGTAMVGIYSCWPAREDDNNGNDLADFYAHWSIRELPKAERTARNYGQESKPAIVRLFVGRDLSMVGSLRIDMKDPDTTFVVPLANFSYQGVVGKGQTWSTNLVADDQSLPFFRIAPTSSARIGVTAKSTSALQVQAASTVLNVLRDLSSLAAPGGALVTTLNRDSIQQTSRTLDNALSSIWGQSQEENFSSARQLSEWYPGARFIIQLTIPHFARGSDRRDANGRKIKGSPLTRWYELSLSCPRRSIFSSYTNCNENTVGAAAIALKVLRTRVNAQQVLNTKVSTGTSIQQYVATHDWYARFLRGGDKEIGNDRQQEAAAAPVPAAATIATQLAPPATDGTETVAAAAAPPTPSLPAKSNGKSTDTAKAAERTQSDYSALCSSIVNSLYTIGLSRLDSEIGLWAIITGSPDFVGIQPKFQGNTNCSRLLPLAGTEDAWKFADLK